MIDILNIVNRKKVNMLVHIARVCMIMIQCNKGTGGSTVSRNSDIYINISQTRRNGTSGFIIST